MENWFEYVVQPWSFAKTMLLLERLKIRRALHMDDSLENIENVDFKRLFETYGDKIDKKDIARLALKLQDPKRLEQKSCMAPISKRWRTRGSYHASMMPPKPSTR